MEDIEKWPRLGSPEHLSEPCQIVPIVGNQDGGAARSGQTVKPLWEEQQPIDSRMFPHKERRNGVIPCTLLNMLCLLKAYGIDVRYDVIRKKTVIDLPGWVGSPDNVDYAAMSTIVSLAEANNMQRNGIEEQVLVIGDRNMCNPAVEWMASKPWDGVDRLAAFYATLTTEEGFPVKLKHVLMYKWMLSIVAAAFLTANFRSRGVLTLQGEQG